MTSSGVARHAAVAVPAPPRRTFTYEVPPELSGRLERGSRVRVPFGRRRVTGTVVELDVDPPPGDVAVRSIAELVERPGSLPLDVLELTRFLAGYYLCSWGEAIEAAMPPPGGGQLVRLVRRREGATPEEVAPRAVERRRLVETLPAGGEFMPAAALDVRLRRAIGGAQRAGLVEVERRAADELDDADGPPAPPADVARPEPTAAQRAVLDTLRPRLARPSWEPFLLFGSTGSGKTEVYFRAAEAVLSAGRGVLYLVPEIGLTPLLMQRVRERFGATAVLLHSGLAAPERRAAWRRLREGRCRMAVGTRSAVFAPVRDPGLIVVDEEQDGSYKQDETPRYNGRDLALVRAREADAVVVLGSATPSMESFHRARSGRYRLLRLGGRVHSRPLPEVTIVDMRAEFRERGEIAPLSRELSDRLRACVAAREQALILRNRRGWSAALFCPGCGERVSCANCSIALTWHRQANRLRCHHCHTATSRPASCPRCRGDELHLMGEGSEQIESLVREVVPDAVVERMDRDTIRRRGAHETLLRRFERGEVQVIVGTQMIAKGHDFPNVTLVGVLGADQSLGLPDFRAAERTFQLLTQVAGRAGRGERAGQVVVQAFDADHPLLEQAAAQDYEAFFDREMRYRRALRYPPLSAVVRLLVRDADPSVARTIADRVALALRERAGGRLVVSGPGPAPVERLRGLWRQQVLLRSAGRRRMIGVVAAALETVAGSIPRGALTVDVDPYSLL